MPKCYGYVRVSTDDQEDNGASLKAQQELLVEWHARNVVKNRWDEFRVFIDGGVSAFKRNLPDRPEGSRVLNSLKLGDTIVFTKLDRAFRNVADGNITLAGLQKRGVRVIFLDLGGQPVDASTPAGFIMINSMLTFAQFESMQKADRMRATNKYLIAQRGFASRAFPGHEIYKVGKNLLRQRPDPKQIDVAKRFLACVWTKGMDETGARLKAGEFEFSRKHGNGKRTTRNVHLHENYKSMACQIYTTAIQILYFTKELIPFAKLHGLDASQMLNPKEATIRSPMSGIWRKIKSFHKWEHHYDLSGSAA